MMIMVSLSLTGCLTTNELLNTAVTTGATAVSVAAGVPIVPAVAVTATAGVVTGLITKEPASVDVSTINNEHQAAVVEHQQTIDFWKTLVMYVIGGGVVLAIATWLIPGPQLFRRKSNAGSNTTAERS